MAHRVQLRPEVMRTVPLRRVMLVPLAASVPLDVTLLREEMPSVAVLRAASCGHEDVIIRAREWRESSSFRAFDEAVEASRSPSLTVQGDGPELVRVACEVLTRYQRFAGRRNGASDEPLWERVLEAHATLHDLDKPLVKADHDHALDTWQWMLRLEPAASLAPQLAALFHDVERLESEADRRIEHHAPDYQAFKDAHARTGADRTHALLVAIGVDGLTAARTRDIVASHERRGRDPDVDLLNDADALSFFSLNSSGYADYFGVEQTRRKIAYTLCRMGARARARLALCRLRPDVAHLLATSEAA